MVRQKAHARVEDHLDEEREIEREEQLARTFRAKHKQETHLVKAAHRRLEAIRNGAHCKVDDRLTADEAAYKEELQEMKRTQLRQARRELKAHRRNLKKIKAYTHWAAGERAAE